MGLLSTQLQLAVPLAPTIRRQPHSWAPGARPSLRCRAACQAPQQQQLELPAVSIRAATSEGELQQAAQLRAEAYHEAVQYGRFTSSFVKQFAEREAYNLIRRAREAAQSPAPPRSLTLVAVEGQAGSLVAGTLDIRLATAEQVEAFGLDPEGPRPAYLSNVAVRGSSRGRGIGRQLIEGAKVVARGTLGVLQVYAHAELENKAALRLYERSGFVASDSY